MSAPTSRARHAASLHEVSPPALECRELGHAWTLTTDSKITRGHSGEVIEFTREAGCHRCGAQRRQVIAVPDFTVRSATIAYPDGYLMRGHRVRKPDVRLEVLRRMLEGR